MTIPSGKAREPLIIKLQPCGSASGRLVNQLGEPLDGWRIDVGRLTTEQVDGGYLRVPTEKNGRFRVDGLVPGYPYRVTVGKGVGLDLLAAVVEPGKDKDLGHLNIDK